MFELEKSFTFEAGHQLTHHNGKCSTPHGHSYTLFVKIRGETLHPSGSQKNMVMDLHAISNIVRPMIEEYFDHKWVNETLNTDSASVEFMAQWIYKHLKPKLPQLYAVTLRETATAKVTYSEELQ